MAVLDLLLSTVWFFDIGFPSTLSASSLMDATGYIASIPNDQWIAELKFWESQVYAIFQIAIAAHAIGPITYNPDGKSYLTLANTPAEKELCQMQKMHKAGGFA